MRCWGITDGSAGMVAQVKALAQALHISPEMKTIRIKYMYSGFPGWMYAGILRKFILPYFIAKGNEALIPPWPEMMISCGRRAAMVAMGLKARIAAEGGRQPYYIHLQDPKISPENFDVLITPDHDSVQGANVIKTRYALHSITPRALAEARNVFTAHFAAYPSPRMAVLLGGSTHKYQLNSARMEALIKALEQTLADNAQSSLLITPSRRSGEPNIAALRETFANNPRVYIYDGAEPNPYMGLLALADAIIVTNDSVNMMSEAYATGKPIYILPMPGHTNTKPARFAERLIKDGIARPLVGKMEQWNYQPLDEMETLAAKVKDKLGI